MNQELLVLFPISIACDVAGQVFFKLGADRLPSTSTGGPGQFLSRLLSSRWLLAGIATFAFETILWLKILAEAPLSVAFPIASLNFIGVTLASRLLFGETVDTIQWFGCVMVTAGVAILATAGAGS